MEKETYALMCGTVEMYEGTLRDCHIAMVALYAHKTVKELIQMGVRIEKLGTQGR